MTENPSSELLLSEELHAVRLQTDLLQRDMSEIKDRARRIETRVTAYLGEQGFDLIVQKPKWSGSTTLAIPSLNTPIRDILEAIEVRPSDHDQPIFLVHKGVTKMVVRPVAKPA